MRALFIPVVMSLALACGGDDGQRPSASPEPSRVAQESTATEPQPDEGAETPAGSDWLSLVRTLRVDMRVGRPVGERGQPIAEVEAALEAAGGSIDCSQMTWVSDEAGVEDGQCTGTIPIEGTDGMVIANFRRYEIPDEPEAEGLLHISLGGPFLGNDAAIEPWLDAVRAELEPHFGAPAGGRPQSGAARSVEGAVRRGVQRVPVDRRTGGPGAGRAGVLAGWRG